MNPAHFQRKLHNVIVVGDASPALAAALDRFSVHDARVESRVTWIAPEQAGAPVALPPDDDSDVEAYAWLFANHRDIGSPALADVLARAMETSATFLYVYCASDEEADALQTWAAPGSERARFGVLLTPYTADRFPGLDLFLACTGERKTINAQEALSNAQVRATDPLYPHARRLVLDHGSRSLSLVQRSLHIGYSHAARLLAATIDDEDCMTLCR